MVFSKSDYSSFFYSSPFPSLVYDLATFRLIDVNQAAIGSYGYPRELFLKRHLTDLIPEDEWMDFLAGHVGLEDKEGKSCLGVFTQLTAQGGRARMEIHIHRASVGDRPYMLAVCRDVSKEEIQDRRLRDSEEKLKALSAMAKIGYWELCADKATVSWTDEVYRIFGKDKETFRPDFDRFLDTIHPDDRIEVERELDAVFAGQKQLDFVFRIRQDDGSVRWVKAIGRMVKDTDSQLIAYEGTVQDITDQKSIELRMNLISKELMESEQRFRTVQEISPDGFTLLRPYRDETGRVVDFTWVFQNKAVEKIHGLSSEDVFGKRLLELFPSQRDSRLFKFFVEVADKGVSRVLDEIDVGEIISVPTWLRIVVVSIGEDIAVLTQDITEQKTAREKLAESENKYRTIFDIASVGIAQADPSKGRISLINSYYETITGYTRDELYNMNFRDITHPDDRQMDWEIYQKAARGEIEYRNEKRYVRKDGSIVWVRLHVAFVRDRAGKPIISVAICEDITERKLNEQKLLALNESLKRQARDLKLTNAELEQFAFITSHDLQEPLRMISGFMDQLKRKYGDQLDEKANQYIHFASDGAKRMKALVLDLLEYSRAGRNVEPVEKVSLNEVFDDYQLLRRKLITEKNVKIGIPKLPVVDCYKAPITQAIHALMDNAIRYAKAGVSPCIDVMAEDKRAYWQIGIADNGIGIDAENFEKIFILFERLDHKDNHDATGVGLPIAKKQVESWGGQIWVESTLGEGSVFYFTIPKS